MKREVPGHPSYLVTDQGTVLSIHGTIEKPLVKDICNGYARVTIDGEKRYVGRLVLETFDPPMDITLQAFHIDGDTLNDSLDNLMWLSRSRSKVYASYSRDYRESEEFLKELA